MDRFCVNSAISIAFCFIGIIVIVRTLVSEFQMRTLFRILFYFEISLSFISVLKVVNGSSAMYSLPTLAFCKILTGKYRMNVCPASTSPPLVVGKVDRATDVSLFRGETTD